MNFEEALRFWHSRVDFERKPARPSDLKLERMFELLSRLGNPHDQLRIVHIAGSKGKGSTAAMFAAVGQAAGLRTGIFTSPHLVDVSERIQIDGEPISGDDIVRLLTEMRPAVEAMESAGTEPTFFEIATAMAFLHFAQQQVDLAVFEVGLGGRFDATNVCMPVLSVITSISYEHTAILGDQLSQIAFEKAGIIKPGVPVVSGVTELEAAQVIRQFAAERGSSLTELGRDFTFDATAGRVSKDGDVTPAVIEMRAIPFCHSERSEESPEILRCAQNDKISLGLLGQHQAVNASLAVVGCQILRDLGVAIDERAIGAGLSNVRWPARMEVFRGPPLTVLDCAHNVASMQALIETLDASFPQMPCVLLFAASADKDIHGIMDACASRFDRFVFTHFKNSPRTLSAETIAQTLHLIRPDAAVVTVDESSAALNEARQDKSALVVIAGSVYLAGELRPILAR